jgi:phenylpyruvate tautomerase PptA (4-oxalocrotonate tautomerase family)
VTREQTALLIEGVSRLLLDVLNKSMNSTFVVIDELDVENWDGEVFLSRNAESEWLPRPMSPIPSSWASRRNEHRAYTASHDGCRSRRLKFGSS